jgi:hypothetical protein
MTNTKRKGHWHNCVRTHQTNCVDNQIFQLLKGGIDQWGVDHNNLFFSWVTSEATNPWVAQIGEVNQLMLGQQWQHELRCKFNLWWG